MAENVKFFSIGLFHKKKCILDGATQRFIMKKEGSSKPEESKVVNKQEMLYIDHVDDYNINKKKINAKWKYSFTLRTTSRQYAFFARNEEEQFLWLSAFYRICGIQVADTAYKVPMQIKMQYQALSQRYQKE
jgi:hypothetical protein